MTACYRQLNSRGIFSRFCTRIVNVAAALFLITVGVSYAQETPNRPNILLIVADDLGYSDLGSYGGEINTPNLDQLASMGMRFTSFYASPTCSPTRAMLLTGVDNHVAGLGNMGEWLGARQKGNPGYEGYLNNRAVGIAPILQNAGYHTYMAGKWHLGEEETQWPSARGFDRAFSVLDGAGSYWPDMMGFTPGSPDLTFDRNGDRVTALPESYYSTKNFTDFIIDSIDADKDDDQPFFAYLAYQAPHGPLALPDDWIGKYRGRYDDGYDAVRDDRLARQKQLGLVDDGTVGFPRLSGIPAWIDLSDNQKRQSSRKMELYAAMVENMDDNIGRLIKYLESKGKLSNTIIIFISDNGAAGEDIAELIESQSAGAKDWFAKTFDNRFENWGRPGSAVDYGPAWAQISTVPFRQFKGVLTEGGIRLPMIIAGPGIDQNFAINNSLVHVMDIVPTIIDLAGTGKSLEELSENAAPIQGKSIAPILTGKVGSVRDDTEWLGWELFGNRAIRQGDWKLLYLLKKAGGTGTWQLFNLRDDPAELLDVSQDYPKIFRNLVVLWEQYVSTNGVILEDAGPFADSG